MGASLAPLRAQTAPEGARGRVRRWGERSERALEAPWPPPCWAGAAPSSTESDTGSVPPRTGGGASPSSRHSRHSPHPTAAPPSPPAAPHPTAAPPPPLLQLRTHRLMTAPPGRQHLPLQRRASRESKASCGSEATCSRPWNCGVSAKGTPTRTREKQEERWGVDSVLTVHPGRYAPGRLVHNPWQLHGI